MTARRIYVPAAMPSRDPNGRALPAKLRFYDPGTAYSTPATVYADETLTTPLAWPVLSDAYGRFPAIWADDAETFDVTYTDQVFDRSLGGPYTNVSPVTDATAAGVALAESAADEAVQAANEAVQSATNASASANQAAAIVETLEGYTEGVVTSATNVNVTHAGTGAVVRSVKARLDDWVSVKDFGAIGDQVTDDTAAIQAAIDYCEAGALVGGNQNPATPGRTLYFPPGLYSISSTLTLPAGVTLQGAGQLATQIFLVASSNCATIKTKNFDDLVGSGKAWFDSTISVPTMFGIKGMTLECNRFQNTSGAGVQIYGYNYIIEDLIIAYAADDGFYSRHEGVATDTFTKNLYKHIENRITNLKIWDCDGYGFNYTGPTDAQIDGLFVAFCGKKADGVGNIGAWIDSSVDVGLMHVYACGATNGSNSPVGVYITKTCRIDTLITESHYGEGLRVNSWHVAIDKLQMYQNCRAYGSYGATIMAGARHFSASYAEAKLIDYAVGGISVEAPHASFGAIKVVGETSPYTTYTATGFRQASTAHYLTVDSLLVQDLRGTGAVGAAFNQGGATKGSKIKAQLVGCTTGANPGSGFSHGANVAITIEKASSDQAYSSASFPAVTYGAQVITQISETGGGSAG